MVLGGFASGTVSGVRTPRYHAVLLVATTPPAGRVVLVNGFDAWGRNQRWRTALSTQRYTPTFDIRMALIEAGLGHVSEIADGHPPFTPAGCPFQAWSMGELLRIEAILAHTPAVDTIFGPNLTPLPVCGQFGATDNTDDTDRYPCAAPLTVATTWGLAAGLPTAVEDGA
jgi:Glycogen debranching enzyme N terminal/Amylo-alpha-1,6-glucosidase